MATDINAAAAAAAAAARRAAEEARRRAEEARKKAAEAAKQKAAAAAAAAQKAKAKAAREKPSTRFEALKKSPAVRRESKSTRFEALKKEPTRRESKSTRFEALKATKKADEKREVSKAAKAQYEKLQEEAGTKKALEQLGVKTPRDFQKLGDDYTKNQPIDVSRVTNRRALGKVLEASAAAQETAAGEKMKNPAVAALVANGVEGKAAVRQAPKLEQVGMTADDISELATKAGPDHLATAADSLSTLGDEEASDVDKATALLELGGEGGKLLPEGVREKAVGKAFGKLPDAAQALSSIDTLASGDAGAQEKAKAALDLATQLKDVTGAGFPKLASKLSGLDGPLKIAGSAMTLIDGDASLRDRAIAGAELATALPGLKGDVSKLRDVFKKAGVDEVADVVEQGDDLGKLAAKGVDLDTVRSLPEARVKQLAEIATKLEGESANQLASAVKGLDKKGLDAFIDVASKMEAGTLSEVMASSDEAKQFTSMLSKLDPKNVDAFAKAASEMDSGALKLITKLGGSAPASVVNDFVPTLAKVAGNELVGKALGAFDKLLGVMKLDVTGDVAAKALKGLGKLLPGISAGVSGADAVKFGVDAAKLQGKQDDLAFLAHTGMKLNALDAALEFIPGVGTLAGVGTGVAALALDLGFSAEKAKFEKDPSGYEAPDWVKAANVGVAMIGPPPGAGIPELIATYGAKDAAELGLWAVGQGGKLAEAAWEVIKKVGGVAVEIAMEAVEQLKNLGEAGVEALKYIAKAPGELGAAVAEAAVSGLKDIGEAGVEALKDIAGSGVEVAKFAAEGLKDLADAGLDVAKDALGTLKDVPGAVGDFVSGLGDLLPDINLPGPL